MMSVGGSPGSDQTPFPTRVGSFELVAEIGRGGMGEVFRARDAVLGREVALKRPRSELLGDGEFHLRLIHEARTASKLMHPNITTVFEVFEEDGVPWLVMELVDGASLRSLLDDHRPLPLEDILRHAEGLSDALRVAHNAGILHRDINPNNILIGADGRARLSDFGLVRAFEGSGGGAQVTEVSTEAGDWVGAGTPGYMSPEQVLGKPLDGRSDNFSLGLVLYEMATGRPAFSSTDRESWVEALLHRDPEPVSQVNRNIPHELDAVVRKAMAKRPFQRFASAAELLLEVQAVRSHLASNSSRPRLAAFTYRLRRRRWLAAAAVSALAMAMAILGMRASLEPPPELTGHHRRLTTHPGWDGEAALSPDGTMVVYVSDATGNLDLWVMLADGAGPGQQRTFHPGSDRQPAWFPDGTEIAFASERDGEGAIWRVPVLGGTPTMVVANAAQPAISPDGARIAFVRANQAGLTRIAVTPIDDPAAARILTDDGDGRWAHESPAWSPDGRTLSYNDHRNLWLVSAAGGPAQQLTADELGDCGAQWLRGGLHLVFSSVLRDGVVALWTVAASGRGSPRRLTAGTSSECCPSPSRSRSRLVYGTSAHDSNVTIRDLETGQRGSLPSMGEERYPTVAPDGRFAVYTSDRGGRSAIWLQPLDGLAPGEPARQLTSHEGTVALPAVSPDGAWVAYGRAWHGQRDVWLVPSAGGVPRQITTDPGHDIHPAFSADGSVLAWVSDRGGAENVWAVRLAGGRPEGTPWRLTHGDAADLLPAFSPDGRWLAFVEERGNCSEVMVQRLDSGDPPLPLTRGANARQARWGVAGDEVLVSGTWGGDRVVLRAVSLDGRVRPLEPELALGPDEPAIGFFGSGHGGRLLSYATIGRSGDVWLAEMTDGRR